MNTSAPDLFVWDTTRYTDWQEELVGGTARYRNLSAGLSGGNQQMKYLLRATYQNQSTVMPGDFKDRQGTLHFNINNTSLNQKFTIQFTGELHVQFKRVTRC